MKQSHPIFAQLLRPAVEAYYDVQTTVPVGDAPREADFVLLRRTISAPPPFRGLWRHLSPWNIMEFKGPTVSPRRDNVELLVELGLGIDRRLREERGKQRQRRLRPEEVSFWYLANHLGQRFLRAAEQKLGRLDLLGPGWREIEAMARTMGKRLDFDIRPVIESLGLERVLEQVGMGRVIAQVGIDRFVEQVGKKELIKRIGLSDIFANLSPAQAPGTQTTVTVTNAGAFANLFVSGEFGISPVLVRRALKALVQDRLQGIDLRIE